MFHISASRLVAMAVRDGALSVILGRDDVRVIGIIKASPGAAGSAAH